MLSRLDDGLNDARRAAPLLRTWLASTFLRLPDRKSSQVGYGFSVAILYLIGLGAIHYVLNGGSIQLSLHDWAEVTAPRYAFLKDAVTKGELPLHMPGFWGLRNITDRFLAIPDTNLGPQVLLLRFLDLGQFFLVQTWLLYSLGFLGLLLLARYLHLSFLSLAILSGMLFFNGHIIDHIVVGHVNWAANYLIPFFVYLLLRLLDGWQGMAWIAAMALFLFALALQGAFHLFIACGLFLGLLWFVAPVQRGPILLASLFAAGLSAVRFLPPVLELQAFDTEFLSGYPTTLTLVEALVVLRPTFSEFVFSRSGLTNLNWWEFDLYIGLAGTILVLTFGTRSFLYPPPERAQYRLFAFPIVAMSVLAIGRIYSILHLTQIPLLSSQRVSSRIIFVPFAVIVILAIDGFQRWLDKDDLPGIIKTLVVLSSVLIANDIWQHTKLWRVVNMGRIFPPKELDLAVNVVANHPDPAYTLLLLVGLAVSLLSLLLLIYLTLKSRLLNHTDRVENG